MISSMAGSSRCGRGRQLPFPTAPQAAAYTASIANTSTTSHYAAKRKGERERKRVREPFKYALWKSRERLCAKRIQERVCLLRQNTAFLKEITERSY